MKKYFILALLLLVATLGFAQDFTQVTWGMTKEQVIKEKGTPGVNSDEMVVYYTTLFDTNCCIRYEFGDNKLISVSCLFANSTENFFFFLSEKFKNKYPVFNGGGKNFYFFAKHFNITLKIEENIRVYFTCNLHLVKLPPNTQTDSKLF